MLKKNNNKKSIKSPYLLSAGITHKIVSKLFYFFIFSSVIICLLWSNWINFAGGFSGTSLLVPQLWSWGTGYRNTGHGSRLSFLHEIVGLNHKLWPNMNTYLWLACSETIKVMTYLGWQNNFLIQFIKFVQCGKICFV